MKKAIFRYLKIYLLGTFAALLLAPVMVMAEGAFGILVCGIFVFCYFSMVALTGVDLGGRDYQIDNFKPTKGFVCASIASAPGLIGAIFVLIRSDIPYIARVPLMAFIGLFDVLPLPYAYIPLALLFPLIGGGSYIFGKRFGRVLRKKPHQKKKSIQS